MVGGRWKSQHRKIVYLSPSVEKPFNSKVIKSFLPELRSRKVFRVSEFLCYLYMSYEHSMYISRIHVWLCNNGFRFFRRVARAIRQDGRSQTVDSKPWRKIR